MTTKLFFANTHEDVIYIADMPLTLPCPSFLAPCSHNEGLHL